MYAHCNLAVIGGEVDGKDAGPGEAYVDKYMSYFWEITGGGAWPERGEGFSAVDRAIHWAGALGDSFFVLIGELHVEVEGLLLG